ncbi:hypothetical protein GHT06_008312 [Daphnia sinensis]|uniref:Uncharacterized protein n=1 Tax=Daphnia sinensis TaxID=1820382 RepID=A0AAD5PYU8_9CRUS|nr:hypothetical protein GHT06_008312 [Daphnia sinensis]
MHGGGAFSASTATAQRASRCRSNQLDVKQRNTRKSGTVALLFGSRRGEEDVRKWGRTEYEQRCDAAGFGKTWVREENKTEEKKKMFAIPPPRDCCAACRPLETRILNGTAFILKR